MLDWIRTFLAVYRTGSVSGAARSLHLSQPTVSYHLRSLEAHVGTTLFDRLPRGVSSTSAGHDLANAVGTHLDLVEVAVDGARRQTSRGVADTIRIGGPAELMSELVVPAMTTLLEEGTGLRVTLGLADELVAALRKREIDLVVATARVRSKGVSYERVYDEEFVLVAGARWAARVPPRAVRRRGAAALDEAPLLAYAQHLPIMKSYWRHVFGVRLSRSPRLLAPDLRLLRAAAIAGAGITVLPRYLVDAALARGELVQLATPAEPPSNTIHLAYRTGEPDAPVELARDLLRRSAARW